VRDSLWPNTAIDSRYWSKPEVQADYPRHRLLGTIADLGATDIYAEAVTVVLLGAPVVVCNNSWGHAYLLVDIDSISGNTIVGVFLNSWGLDWGDQGYFKETLGRGYGVINDAQALLHMLAGQGVQVGRTIHVPVSAVVVPASPCDSGQCPASVGPVRSLLFGRRR
jgi:hypothetical protein